jgi:nucleoside-diphosphate kinase
MQRTVVIVKPDAVKKGFIGKITARLEEEGFKMVAGKFIRLDHEILSNWYEHHKDKPFFPELVAFMTETPVAAMVWEGEDVIFKVREICGPTDSKKATKGTIRGDFGEDIQRNAIHASENEEAAKKEMGLMFEEDEIHAYEK